MADNPSSRFKFVSPGVFVDEIDNSELPAIPASVGPVVIGRARRGPAMQPVRLTSYSDFVDTFGEPIAGPEAGDVWREGNILAPTYGAIAAQAWLRNNAPLNYVRLVGTQDSAANEAGYAGWKAGTISSDAAAGGSWGLFVFPSGTLAAPTTGLAAANVTGALAAIMYITEGRLLLSGTTLASGTNANSAHGSENGGVGFTGLSASACSLYESDSNGNLTLSYVKGDVGSGSANEFKLNVSLDPKNRNFIRKVLNTNPTLTNTSISKRSTASGTFGLGNFWLGESFERQLMASSSAGASMGVLSDDIVNTKFHAVLLPLRNNENRDEVANDFRYGAQKGTTGFFIGQDLGGNSSYQSHLAQKLFRLEALTPGDHAQTSIKISISNIKAPEGEFNPYGSFSVLVRKLSDTDNVPVIIERFDNLNLNPASENYIAKVIGDKYQVYDSTIKDNRTYGQFENRSKYVYVVMDEDVDAGLTNEALLPFGVYGPLKYRNVTLVSGSDPLPFFAKGSTAGSTAYPSGSNVVASIVDGGPPALLGIRGGYRNQSGLDTGDTPGIMMASTTKATGSAYTASIVMPGTPIRMTNTWGEPKSLKNTFWGAWTGRSATDQTFDPGIIDTLRPKLKGLQTNPASTTHDIQEANLGFRAGYGVTAGAAQSSLSGTDPLVISWVFTLDDVSGSTAEGYRWMSGSRQSGKSVSAVSASYTGTLAAGLDRFTTVLHGGYEGFDVTEADPYRDSSSTFTDATNPKNSYQLNSLRQAINVVSDPEVVQMNLATIPGIVQPTVTKYLLDTVEERGDSMAIIDIRNVYTPKTENTQSAAERNSFTIDQAVQNLRDRNLNTSYGATYAPWVRIQEPTSQRTLWAPPSIVALGALSTTDRDSFPWYAPAGFQRGGLSDGDGGIPVLDVSKRLSQDDRDRLYEVNINPIAKFPAEGIVIFGQKTLQQTASALDRINVRRLMIFLKREISFIASRLLFEQNTVDTWNNFKGQALPILEEVKSQYGIEDFRLILDESTTTPDLVDRNIIYAKLLVKPTRSVEFFAIDFVVTNSGAGFED
jgi:hypothetical protein